MKIVKVKIRRGGVGEDMMVYPTAYNAEEVDHNGLGPTGLFGSGGYSGGIGKGQSTEYCLIVLEDALADAYALDKDMDIIDPSEADALVEQWRIDKGESEEIVDDRDRLLAIQVKQGAGIPLSAEDLKALNPNDSSVKGINKRLQPVAKVITEKGLVLKNKAGSIAVVASK